MADKWHQGPSDFFSQLKAQAESANELLTEQERISKYVDCFGMKVAKDTMACHFRKGLPVKQEIYWALKAYRSFGLTPMLVLLSRENHDQLKEEDGALISFDGAGIKLDENLPGKSALILNVKNITVNEESSKTLSGEGFAVLVVNPSPCLTVGNATRKNLSGDSRDDS